ncbi:MAG: AAA family ATPase [Bacteroidales bacterium]|nr:AAA family ATPase [Bacteroidales bacterium]MDD3989679.1 AAA family ATPase [Bacteroidales bacterium]MDD4638229.1 AAA family ATPase [Bacteroidales bacterium]
MRKTYLNRSIDSHLLEWKRSVNHKPLLLRGARQVGKSSAIKNFAKTFDYFIEVNFEKQPSIKQIFEADLTPKEIAARLSTFYGVPVIPGRTLLFFDEVQSCPNAVHSLWFFYEDYPDLHVIAAGSLLEFTLKKMASFGVGRIRSMYMYPMSFDEFLDATGNGTWIEAKQKSSPQNPLFEALHKKLVESFRTYLMVGGMPEAVSMWVETGDYLNCQQIHNDIIQTYEDDFSKYAGRIEPLLLRQVLHSVARQVGSKFVYRNVQGDYRTEKVKEALELLSDAGLVKPVIHTAANGLPLGSEINEKFVKYLFADNGLLLSLLSMESAGSAEMSQLILIGTASDLVNKGNITEMVAGLELLKYSNPFQRHDLYYWQNLKRGSQAEVDYVIAHNMKIVPVEIKSGTSGSMKSLFKMIEEKHLSYGIRSSLENFGMIENVRITPVYALSNLFRI